MRESNPLFIVVLIRLLLVHALMRDDPSVWGAPSI